MLLYVLRFYIRLFPTFLLLHCHPPHLLFSMSRSTCWISDKANLITPVFSYSPETKNLSASYIYCFKFATLCVFYKVIGYLLLKVSLSKWRFSWNCVSVYWGAPSEQATEGVPQSMFLQRQPVSLVRLKNPSPRNRIFYMTQEREVAFKNCWPRPK